MLRGRERRSLRERRVVEEEVFGGSKTRALKRRTRSWGDGRASSPGCLSGSVSERERFNMEVARQTVESSREWSGRRKRTISTNLCKKKCTLSLQKPLIYIFPSTFSSYVKIYLFISSSKQPPTAESSYTSS